MCRPSYPILAVTNRHLCKGDFYQQVQTMLQDPAVTYVMLREKDLTPMEYIKMAERILSAISTQDSIFDKLIFHSFYQEALSCGIRKIHLPFSLFQEIKAEHALKEFHQIGTSIHSRAEAIEAQRLGATYVTAGHIFDTQCKPDLPGRGLNFLTDIVESVTIPVYAIGGIHPHNVPFVLEAGATGVCMMSEYAN